MRATVSKKQRVDLTDVNQFDGPKGLSLQRPITPHGLSDGNMIFQSNVQMEHPPNVGRSSEMGRSSNRTVLALPPAQAAPTPSSSISVKQEIRSASVALAPHVLMPEYPRPNQSPTPTISCTVPQPGYKFTGGDSLTFPINQEAPRSISRRQGQLFLSELQNNPPRPPETTPRIIPNPSSLPNSVIDLCSSEDEGPMDNDDSTRGRYNQKEAQDLKDIGPLTEEESDSDYWSDRLSDVVQEEPGQALYPVGKVQPTYIHKGWIPPVSSFTMALHEFTIDIVYLDFYRTSSSS